MVPLAFTWRITSLQTGSPLRAGRAPRDDPSACATLTRHPTPGGVRQAAIVGDPATGPSN
jgi:hypothetical protein